MSRAEDRDRIPRRLRAILGDPRHGAAIGADLTDGLPTLPAWIQDIVRDLLVVRGPLLTELCGLAEAVAPCSDDASSLRITVDDEGPDGQSLLIWYPSVAQERASSYMQWLFHNFLIALIK